MNMDVSVLYAFFLVFVRAIADAAGCKITDAAVEKALDRANNGKSRRSDN